MAKLEKKPQLTAQQKRFADEYLTDLNATRAYRVAYPAVKNDETAGAAGARLLKNVRVRTYVDERIKARRERIEVTQDRVIQELAAIAFANAPDYATVKGGIVTVRDTSELTANQCRAIAGIKQGRDGVELKLCDKEKALELLGRHLGMYRDKVEVSGLDAEKSKLRSIMEQMTAPAEENSEDE